MTTTAKVVSNTVAEDFARYMDFSLGMAFTDIWNGGEDVLQNERVKERIKDAFVWQPGALHPQLREQLTRKLISLAENFTENVFLLLSAILSAAAGDYKMLTMYIQSTRLLGETASELMFDEAEAS